jgi:hypothetical protein
MTDAMANIDEVTFEEFCEEWLSEFREGNLPPFEKGQRFAIKLVTQWLNVTEDDDDLVLCDGSGDGGIDIAYLHRADIDGVEQEGQATEGDTWYLIQSKYGTAFQGQEIIVNEGRKVITTLAGENNRLSEHVSQLLGRLNTFRQQASERDRIILVFATDRPMTESDRQALNDVRSIGRERFPNIFDVEDISLQTIWEARDTVDQTSISLPIVGNFVDPSAGLRVGTIPLTDLYQFLKAYRDKTGNLDQLYEKNVRQFLGSRRKINRGIAETLNERPEMFGLYNNGITIVVSDYSTKPDGSCLLHDPYVVNGCQTTKTIWQVLAQKLEAGGTGISEVLDKWRARADRGVVVTKIVKSNNAEITEITKFTNSQNAVRDQDFIALRDDFRTWATAMADHYGIFLEIQRGSWEAQKVYQKAHPKSPAFAESVNAFDLIKVLGAGWQGEPGLAFNKNAPFLPGGTVFRTITNRDENDELFGAADLYSAYKMKIAADGLGFGRSAPQIPRRQTRFLFYYVTLRLLWGILVARQLPTSPGALTKALLALAEPDHQEVFSRLLEDGANLVDDYLTAGSELCAHKEPAYNNDFNQDMNGFLKWERLGKGDHTPILTQLIGDYQRDSRRTRGGNPSLADSVYLVLGS